MSDELSPKQIREAERAADKKARAEEMLKRFNEALEELNCSWIYVEVRHNGLMVDGQLAFKAN